MTAPAVTLEPMSLGRLLIVSDKSADRAALLRMCRSRDVAEDLQTVESGSEALQHIRQNHPDVMLLDCELADMSGFEVLSRLEPSERPPSIMLARDERFAVQAFESAAVDYLTKPVSSPRFDMAVGRAHAQLLARAVDAFQRDMLATVQEALARSAQAPAPGVRLIGERSHRLHFLATDTIDYIESDGNYVTMHVGETTYTSRDTVKRLAIVLAGAGFERIRRDTLINLNRVAFAERLGQATLVFTMTSGARLTSRSGYRLELASSLRRAAEVCTA
jgi:two-component system, LytTR family, response regulator